MGKIFLTYRGVPELAPLSPAKRIEVILASGGRFGKTPQFRRVWLLGVILSFGIPTVAGLIVYFWSDDSGWATWTFVGLGLLGYSTWFHIRTSCLRPHIRAYLAENEGKEEMNNDELILAELRKIAAWADMQRKITRWSFIALAVFIPAMIVVPIVVEHRFTKTIEDTKEKPEWYNVDQNVRQGDFDKAIRIGEELILKTPQYPYAHQRLAGAYLAAGKIEKAREHYAEAFRLFPSEENQKLLVAIEKRSKAESPQPSR